MQRPETLEVLVIDAVCLTAGLDAAPCGVFCVGKRCPKLYFCNRTAGLATGLVTLPKLFLQHCQHSLRYCDAAGETLDIGQQQLLLTINKTLSCTHGTTQLPTQDRHLVHDKHSGCVCAVTQGEQHVSG